MTKKMTIHTIPVPRTKGFTLIEMLVVAALIAIFAGLAVFNIVEQLQREKEKAALAEARSIATAMSFAYDDLGFFPKLCFLKFGVDEMRRVIAAPSGANPEGKSLPQDAIDYMGFGSDSMLTKVTSNWKDKYMGGSMPEKFVTMRIEVQGGNRELDWPADPFRQPYVLYLLKIDKPVGNALPEIDFVRGLGEKANYFAGVVSYGRNKAPGLKWDERDSTLIANRRTNNALFVPTGDERVFEQYKAAATSGGMYNDARLDMLVEKSTDVDHPNIRDVGSDDKYFEF